MQQLTEQQAIALAESKLWENWTADQKVRFQLLSQERLVMPFGVFRDAVAEVLGRPVRTIEFVYREFLMEEYLGTRPAPTLQEIMDLIPADKRILIQA